MMSMQSHSNAPFLPGTFAVLFVLLSAQLSAQQPWTYTPGSINYLNAAPGSVNIYDRGDGCCSDFRMHTTSGQETHFYTYNGAFEIHKYGTGSISGPAFTILPSGYTGIGTTNPGSMGDGGNPTILHVAGASGTTPYGLLNLSTTSTAAGNPTGAISFGTTSSTGFQRTAAIYSWMTAGSGSNATGNLAFYTANAGNVTQRMTIAETGNVGIGTVSPGTARVNIVSPTADNSSYGLIVQNSGSLPILYARGDGNVGIGTTSPSHTLHVAGTIGAQEVIVSSTGADYVFEPGYQLQPLNEVARYIQANHHLPDIPSAADVKDKGVALADMQAKLLAKIEELTLHMIREQERNDELEHRNLDLGQRLARLEANSGSLPKEAK